MLLLLIGVGLFGFWGMRQWNKPLELIDWRTNFGTAQQEATAARKPMLVYFTADWCGPCQEMKRTVWTDADVDKAMGGYVPVKIDVDADEETAYKFGVNGIPRVQIVYPNGAKGPAQVGLFTADEMVHWLKNPR